MRLYTKTGATQIGMHPVYGGPFTPNANGAFDGLPEGLFAELHGRPGWETEDERAHRLATEELDRFRDPAELLKAVRELGANQGLLTQTLAAALGLSGGQSQAPTAEPPGDALAVGTDSAATQIPAREPDAPPVGQGPTDAEPTDTAPPLASPKRTRKTPTADAAPTK